MGIKTLKKRKMKQFIFILVALLLSYSSNAQISGDSTIVPGIVEIDSIVYSYTGVCQNQAYGEIELMTYPQTNSYFYEWVGQGTITSVVNVDSLDAGTYTFDIFDNSMNWLFRINIIIEEPQQISTFTLLSNPNCFGYDDGSISISNTLGDGPFSYLWEDSFGDDLSNSTLLDSITSGTYVLTTFDTYGCLEQDTFSLIDPLEIVSTTSNDVLNCIDSCDGESTVLVLNGGVPPFTYTWNDPSSQDTQVATNLCLGEYEVIVTDLNGCTDTSFVSIGNPDTLKLESLVVKDACFNICDGGIDITISGGTSPYNLEWENTDGTLPLVAPNMDNLCPDAYILTFTDANGCVETENILVNEQDSFIVNSYITPISCYGYCDGEIGIHFTNQENTPINYFWSNGSQDTIAQNLCTDSIFLVITDSKNCIDTSFYQLSNPDSIYITIDDLNDSLKCFGDNNGLISITTNGGNGPYSYNWSVNGSTIDITESISSLIANQYDLIITDNNECVFDTVFSIIEPDEIENTFSVDEPNCFGFSDGFVEALITGGTGSYIYQWSSNISDTTGLLDSILSGTYYLTVFDSNNCRLDDTIYIGSPPLLVLDPTTTNVLCYGFNNGTFSVEPIGGTQPYSYDYFGQNPTQLFADTQYRFVLTDFNGCSTDTLYYSVTQPLPLVLNVSTTDVSCYGLSDGAAIITPSGGISPYQIDWNGEDSNNLSAGNYIVNIIDDNSCTKTDTINIIEPNEITIVTNVIKPSCFGYSNGSITGSAIGGNGSLFTFFPNWNDLDSVSTGTYTLIATDAIGCASTPIDIVVDEPNELTLALTNIIDISCFDDNDGSISPQVNGGTVPYNFSWTGPNGYSSNSGDINSLYTGTYYLSIVDNNGCTINSNSAISQPSELISAFEISTNYNNYQVSCYNECDAEISTTSSGGTLPYSITWSNGMTGQGIENICAGNIAYTLTDGNGCIYNSENIPIQEPNQITANLDILDDASCFGVCDGSAELSNLSGGVPPFSVNWLGNNEIGLISQELCSGNNEIEISDLNNCTVILSININSPQEIIPDFFVSPDYGQAPLTSTITNNSTGADSFIWSISNLFNDSIINEISFQNTINVFGEYEITLTAFNSITNCSANNSQFISIEGMIELPNVISPNGDGINDYLSFNSYGINEFKMDLYNRWGTLVFKLSDVNEKWNGNSITGEPLPEGVYFYFLEANGNNGSKVEQRGNITLYR